VLRLVRIEQETYLNEQNGDRFSTCLAHISSN